MLQVFNAEISIVGIVIAAVANIIVGMLWYGPVMGNQWMEAVGKKKEELVAKGSDYAFSIVSALITATFLSFLISYAFVNAQLIPTAEALGEDFILSGAWGDIVTAIIVSVFVWLVASLPLLVNRKVWEGTNLNLVLINGVHNLVSLLVMGIIVTLTMDLG